MRREILVWWAQGMFSDLPPPGKMQRKQLRVNLVLRGPEGHSLVHQELSRVQRRRPHGTLGQNTLPKWEAQRRDSPPHILGDTDRDQGCLPVVRGVSNA